MTRRFESDRIYRTLISIGVATATTSAVLLLPGNAALATVFQCDNDRAASQYPHCTNSAAAGWVYRRGQRSDWNGDDRLAPSSAGFYSWRFTSINGNDATLSVWLANAAFTQPRAEYGVDSDTINTINQNTARSGWTTVGSHFLSGTSALYQVGTFFSSSAHTGADLIQISTFNGFAAATRAPAGESVARPLACGERELDADAEVAAIQAQMLDAVDNYQNLRGSFHVMFANIGQDETVDFELSEATPGSHTKITSATGAIEEQRFDGATVVGTDPGRRSFVVRTMAPAQRAVGPRHYLNAACEPVFVHRQDRAAAPAAADVASPQSYAFWLSGSDSHVVAYKTWKGRPATVIEGRHDAYLADKLGATDFRMMIDDETGVLLDLVGTDVRGEVAYFVHVNELAFDGPVDRAHFAVAAPDGWTEVGLDR